MNEKTEKAIVRALYSICVSLENMEPNANNDGLSASLLELSSIEEEMVASDQEAQKEVETKSKVFSKPVTA